LNMSHSKKQVINFREGITRVVGEFTTYETIEVDQYSKVYKAPRQIGVIASLADNACKMFLYVQQVLQVEQDFVVLKPDKVAKDLKISNSTVYLAIKNLMDQSILAKKGTCEYWINPKLLFNGNRKDYLINAIPDRIEFVNRKDMNTVEYDKEIPEGNMIVHGHKLS